MPRRLSQLHNDRAATGKIPSAYGIRGATKNQGSAAAGIGSVYFRPRNREEEKPAHVLSLSNEQASKVERQRVARPSS